MRHGALPALLLLAAACGEAAGPGPEQAVHAAWASYDAAMRSGDLAALRTLTSAARAPELDAPGVKEQLAMAAALRPAAAKPASCRVEGTKATLVLEAPAEGGTAKGTITFLKEFGAWRVDREDWTIVMAPPPPPPEAPRPMPADVRVLVDRVASTDPAEGAKAWTELSARYDRASAYLRDVREGLEDPRPVTFAIVGESFTGGGRTFHYFTAKPSATGAREPVQTLGQALRYPLWQYEDAGAGGFKGGFTAWWASYAAAKGLPK